MLLIKEVTARELAQLWEVCRCHTRTDEECAQAVLNSLQVKADVRPMTLPDADPSSLQLCTANRDASH
jgi:hypothetical protein